MRNVLLLCLMAVLATHIGMSADILSSGNTANIPETGVPQELARWRKATYRRGGGKPLTRMYGTGCISTYRKNARRGSTGGLPSGLNLTLRQISCWISGSRLRAYMRSASTGRCRSRAASFRTSTSSYRIHCRRPVPEPQRRVPVHSPGTRPGPHPLPLLRSAGHESTLHPVTRSSDDMESRIQHLCGQGREPTGRRGYPQADHLLRDRAPEHLPLLIRGR